MIDLIIGGLQFLLTIAGVFMNSLDIVKKLSY